MPGRIAGAARSRIERGEDVYGGAWGYNKVREIGGARGRGVFACKVSGATFVKRLLAAYDGPAPVRDGEGGAVEGAAAAAEAYAGKLPRCRRLVLVVEGLQAECRRLKDRCHRDAMKGAGAGGRDEALCAGGGLQLLLEAFCAALAARHDVCVKRTRDKGQTDRFVAVLAHKCGLDIARGSLP